MIMGKCYLPGQGQLNPDYTTEEYNFPSISKQLVSINSAINSCVTWLHQLSQWPHGKDRDN